MCVCVDVITVYVAGDIIIIIPWLCLRLLRVLFYIIRIDNVFHYRCIFHSFIIDSLNIRTHTRHHINDNRKEIKLKPSIRLFICVAMAYVSAV